MRDLDETDLEIVRLLTEDARRPYSEIAEHVGLSPPAVSDRIDRLQEQGIVRRFTLDLDRSSLQDRRPVMLTLEPAPAAVEDVYAALAEVGGVEHVFQLSDGTLQAHANAPRADAHAWLRDQIDMDRIDGYDLTHVAAYDWQPSVTAADFAIGCAVCENEVGAEGVTERVDGDVKAFCCPSCQERYHEQYEALSEGE